MAERKLRIYCETSFWSYLNGRPTPLQHIHMANPVTLPKTATIIGTQGYVCPVIITPSEFLERREEFL